MYKFEYWCTNGTHNKSKSVSNVAELFPHITSLILKVLLMEYPLYRLVLKYNNETLLKFTIERDTNNVITK